MFTRLRALNLLHVKSKVLVALAKILGNWQGFLHVNENKTERFKFLFIQKRHQQNRTMYPQRSRHSSHATSGWLRQRGPAGSHDQDIRHWCHCACSGLCPVKRSEGTMDGSRLWKTLPISSSHTIELSLAKCALKPSKDVTVYHSFLGEERQRHGILGQPIHKPQSNKLSCHIWLDNGDSATICGIVVW